ncbi:MAG: hypothetical protein WBC90_12020 [Albidovulum sp.]
MKALKSRFVIVLMPMPNTIEVGIWLNPNLEACMAHDISIDPKLSRIDTEDCATEFEVVAIIFQLRGSAHAVQTDIEMA